jgi:mono/diheme cytochrome c family protein
MALSAGQKTGLLIMAGCFIAFALLSSFVLPRHRPDFPGGRGLRWFMVVVLLLTAGMLSAIVFLAAESKPKSEAAQAANAKGNKPAPTPGNIAAGKAVFASAGCASCHTYTPAGSSGTVGPNLDDLAANARKANRGTVSEYTTESIEDPNAYVVPGFPSSVMPPDFAKTLRKSQIADLVAFLTQPS